MAVAVYPSGEVCISILHPPEEDKYGEWLKFSRVCGDVDFHYQATNQYQNDGHQYNLQKLYYSLSYRC